MKREVSSKPLRSRLIEYLNSPYQTYEKKLFQVNNTLTDKQKMIIIKRLTTENEKYSFDNAYGLRNNKKPSFNSSYSSEILNQYGDQINNSNSITTKLQNQENSIQENKDIFNKQTKNDHQQSYEFRLQAEQKDTLKDPIQYKSHLQLKFNHKNQVDNNNKVQEEHSDVSLNQINSNKDKKFLTTDEQIMEDNENEFKIKNNQNLPLILSQEYKDLFKNNSKKNKQKTSTSGNSFHLFQSNSMCQTPQRQQLNNNQFLFNQIIYQPITHSQPNDPFTDDVDQYSVLRKRKNQDLFSTKISKITPPSQSNMLIQKGNSFFFEKSPKYKSDFLITPKSNLSKGSTINQQNNNSFVNTKFKNASKTIHSTSIYKGYQEGNQKMITNTVIKKQFQNDENKYIQSDYFNENQFNKQQMPNQAKLNQEVDSIITDKSQVKNDALKTLNTETDKDNVLEQSLSKTFSLFSSRKNNIEGSKNILKNNQFYCKQQDNSNGSVLFNNSKFFLSSQEELMNSLDRTTTQKSRSVDKNVNRQDNVLIGDYGEFQYGAISDRVSYNKFNYKIGENEKNIKKNTQLSISSLRKQPLPKNKIVNAKLVSEIPSLGQYDLNLNTIQTNKGLKFSIVQKNQTIKQYQSNEKSSIIEQNKDQQDVKEETSEQYFNKLMNEIKRDVEKQTSQAGQAYLKANSIQELNSIDQQVIDRYSNEISQKLNQCKNHLNNMKQWLKQENPLYQKQ